MDFYCSSRWGKFKFFYLYEIKKEDVLGSMIGWIAIFAPLLVGFMGYILNALITNRIDSLEKARIEDKKLFFEQLNGLRASIEKDYVLQKMYDQATAFRNDKNDEKFKSILAMMNTQFDNIEEKIKNSTDNIDSKVEDLKDLINEKFNGNNKHGG
jgi:hypothetical protein